MSRLRLALLNASQGDSVPNTRRNFRRELDADLVEFVVSEGELPPDGLDVDGVVISGSAASAYWDEEWIEQTRAWVRRAHERDLPILGVCFGHQLLASALGGRVEPMADGDRSSDGGFELGYRRVERVGETPLLEGLDAEFTVFTTHGDTVAELPPGAAVIARNDYGVHGFRLGHAFGVQFHPEYDTDTAEEVARSKAFVGEDRLAAVIDGIDEANYAAACEAKQLFENFTGFARRVRAAGAASD